MTVDQSTADNTVHSGKLNGGELLARYGSPAYVYDLDRVGAALADLRAAVPAGASVLYSLKANPHVDLVRALVDGGCDPEVSSTGELSVALAAGAAPERCFYTGPGKTAEELEVAITAGVRTFSVESATDLHRVAAVADRLGTTVDCVLRVNGSDAPSGAGMRMTGESSQFGIDTDTLIAQADRLGDRLGDAGGARVVGFHFFPLTNAADEAGLRAEILGSIATAARLRDVAGVDVRVLDLGGGFGCPFAQTGERPRYPGLRAPVEAALDEHFPGWRGGAPRVLFESGRHLVGDSGTLLCTVSDVKDSRGAKFAVLDTGINHLGGLSGIGRLLPLSAVPVPADGSSGDTDPAATEKVRLVGPLCTPADTLGRGAPELPPLSAGQVLAVPNVGAYGATASLIGFLSRPAAAELVVRGGEVVSATRLALHRVPVPVREAASAAVPMASELPAAAVPVASGAVPVEPVPAAAVPAESADEPWDEAYPTVLRSVLPRLGEGRVRPQDSLRAAGLDSLALVELLVRLEDAYRVSIPDDVLTPAAFETPASLWRTVESVRASHV